MYPITAAQEHESHSPPCSSLNLGKMLNLLPLFEKFAYIASYISTYQQTIVYLYVIGPLYYMLLLKLL